MTKATRLTVLILVLAGVVSGQNFLVVQVSGQQKWRADEVDKVYLSACLAVEREFGGRRPVRPKITLILGGERDEAVVDKREIRLVKWSPNLFAQGVVVFAFEDLMSEDDRLTMARRAVNWAGSTIEIRDIQKIERTDLEARDATEEFQRSRPRNRTGLGGRGAEPFPPQFELTELK